MVVYYYLFDQQAGVCNSFGGNIIMDSLSKESRDEDNILYRKYLLFMYIFVKKLSSSLYAMLTLFKTTSKLFQSDCITLYLVRSLLKTTSLSLST